MPNWVSLVQFVILSVLCTRDIKTVASELAVSSTGEQAQDALIRFVPVHSERSFLPILRLTCCPRLLYSVKVRKVVAYTTKPDQACSPYETTLY